MANASEGAIELGSEGRPRFFPGALRKASRRALRSLLPVLPAGIRDRIMRWPNTRFHKLIPLVFGGREVMEFRSARLEIDPGDPTLFQVFLLGRYERSVWEVLSGLANEASHLADVGANVGLFALPLARLNSRLLVSAFEPDPEVRERLRRNLRLNPGLDGRVQIRGEAASEREGETRFLRSVTQGISGQGKIALAEREGGSECVVRTVRLDRALMESRPWPDLVKIDVEGHELAVLRGLAGLIDEGLPKWIVLECHPCFFGEGRRESETREILELLEHAGFELSEIGEKGLSPMSEEVHCRSTFHLLASRRGEGKESAAR